MSYDFVEEDDFLHFRKIFRKKGDLIKTNIQIHRFRGKWTFYFEYESEIFICDMDDAGKVIARSDVDLTIDEITDYFYSLLDDMKRTPKYKIKLLMGTEIPTALYSIWNQKGDVIHGI